MTKATKTPAPAVPAPAVPAALTSEQVVPLQAVYNATLAATSSKGNSWLAISALVSSYESGGFDCSDEALAAIGIERTVGKKFASNTSTSKVTQSDSEMIKALKAACTKPLFFDNSSSLVFAAVIDIKSTHLSAFGKAFKLLLSGADYNIIHQLVNKHSDVKEKLEHFDTFRVYKNSERAGKACITVKVNPDLTDEQNMEYYNDLLCGYGSCGGLNIETLKTLSDMLNNQGYKELYLNNLYGLDLATAAESFQFPFEVSLALESKIED